MMLRGALALLLISPFIAPVQATAQTMPAQPPAQPAVSPMPVTSPAATATVDPAIQARAKEWLHRLQTGDIDRTQITEQMSTKLTPDLVKQIAAQLGPLGTPTGFSFVDSQTVQGVPVYRFLATFKSTKLYESIGFDPTGKVAGLFLGPAQ